MAVSPPQGNLHMFGAFSPYNGRGHSDCSYVTSRTIESILLDASGIGQHNV